MQAPKPAPRIQTADSYLNKNYSITTPHLTLISNDLFSPMLSSLDVDIKFRVMPDFVSNGVLFQLQTYFKMAMQLVRRFGFSSKKYFMDQKLMNIQMVADDQLGSLQSLTGIFRKNSITMTYIRTHLQNFKPDLKKQYTISLSIPKRDPEALHRLSEELRQIGVMINVQPPIKVPWFPRRVEEMSSTSLMLEVKDEVNKDHVQFTDQQYRKRRDQIADIAKNYKINEPIPDIVYTPQETDLWTRVFKKLRALHKNSMSSRYERQMQRMNDYFQLETRVPQLNKLSLFLESQTGFRIKPVHGILNQREFLNAFAFKIFSSTQYLRHHQTPDYTPEPDIVHEIVGHIPMFADPQVAELSQRIGLLSLGASDEQVAKLGALYWYTLQFGACKEGDKILGYGAGIASSIGQIEHFISNKAKFKKFQPSVDCDMPYPIQDVQDTYRVTESFEDSLADLETYGKNIMKPVTTSYDFVKKKVIYDRNIEAISSDNS